MVQKPGSKGRQSEITAFGGSSPWVYKINLPPLTRRHFSAGLVPLTSFIMAGPLPRGFLIRSDSAGGRQNFQG